MTLLTLKYGEFPQRRGIFARYKRLQLLRQKKATLSETCEFMHRAAKGQFMVLRG
jgi:hypothetical protein